MRLSVPPCLPPKPYRGRMIRRRGNSFEIRVYAGIDADGKKQSFYATVQGTGRKAEREAKQKEGELLAKAAAGRVPTAAITFDQLADQWLAIARHEKSTRYQTEIFLDRHVRPVLGKKRIEKIGPADLNRLYLALEAGGADRKALAPSTVVRIHGIIRAVPRAGSHQRLDHDQPSGPCSPTPAGREGARIAWCRERESNAGDRLQDGQGDVRVLEARVGDGLAPREHLRPPLARPGPCAGTLLHQRAIGVGKGAPYEKTTKSGASHTIALDRDTVTILRWHRLRLLMRSKDLGGLDPTGYLFSADPTCSKPWRPDHASKRFASVRESAGVKGQLRDLRNFHATLLLDDGFDIKTVSGRLTHARTSTTQDRYQARLPATDRRAAEHVGEKLRRR